MEGENKKPYKVSFHLNQKKKTCFSARFAINDDQVLKNRHKLNDPIWCKQSNVIMRSENILLKST